MQEIPHKKSKIKEKILEYASIKGISKYKIYKDTGITNGVLSLKGGMSEENLFKFISVYRDFNILCIFNDEEPVITDDPKAIEKRIQHNKQNIDQFQQTDNITDLIKLAAWVTDKNKKLEEENANLKRRLKNISKEYHSPKNPPSIAAEPGEE